MIRLKKIALVLFLIAGINFSALADIQRFFTAIHDVPLMPGLAELGDQTVVYDKPGGVFAESLADLGPHSAEGVLSYYRRSLPQFGWNSEGPNNFIRGEEQLIFGFEQLRGRQVLRISLSPR